MDPVCAIPITHSRNQIGPRAAFSRMQFGCNLALAHSVLQSGFVITAIECVLPEELVAECLREKNVMRIAKVQGPLRPDISVVKQAEMLMSAGQPTVNCGNGGRGKCTYAFCTGLRFHKFSSTP